MAHLQWECRNKAAFFSHRLVTWGIGTHITDFPGINGVGKVELGNSTTVISLMWIFVTIFIFEPMIPTDPLINLCSTITFFNSITTSPNLKHISIGMRVDKSKIGDREVSQKCTEI